MNRAFNGLSAAGALALALALVPSPALAEEARMPAGVIELDETVISGNQELPKVLYIVPWQQPEGLPEIELEADFANAELFRRVYPPAHRRELRYYEASRQMSESTVNDSKE